MRVLMLETRLGCEDGFIVRCFQQDKVYHMADFLACVFIRRGWAVALAAGQERERSIP
jgi:hypothetical protein